MICEADCVVEEEEAQEEEVVVSDPLGGGAVFGLSSSASVGSMRNAFPECILEDSGFGEQEGPREVRVRCNSMAGSLQRKSREAAMKAATGRRRHASAPNHVQPSDADKNRTMLFQVGLSHSFINTLLFSHSFFFPLPLSFSLCVSLFPHSSSMKAYE